MLFSKVIPALSLVALVSSAAVPPAVVEETVAKREAITNVKDVPDKRANTSPSDALDKREWGANGICHVFPQPGASNGYSWTDYYFRYDTWGSWDDDWGSGFLDNLRSKCGAEVKDWAFWYDAGAPPTWGHATFKITGFWPGGPNLPDCTRDAVSAASWAWGPIDPPGCDWPGWKWW
ncbi:hypothetical protein H072_1550 [Dactylellina haptotyla CBS 200.50]|uniref:Ecp2 effector protein domain-containing protein n=1 Tax=Dactylellina haptotyla (strain CBS 200.50) TaxID=1284197 RepID=S8ANC7_DACHA|nr:hypothetical protein H072_1550 [Dactylellina haptotyla CBS 200.50]